MLPMSKLQQTQDIMQAKHFEKEDDDIVENKNDLTPLKETFKVMTGKNQN